MVCKQAKSFSERFAEVPRSLVEKVNGAVTEESFLYIGRCIADAITAEAGGLAEMERILDFGCGLGRVTARMLDRAPRAEFTCFDIDPQMLEWCARLLDSPRVRTVSATLDLPPDACDLAVAISVFTHLDTTTDFWLSEVYRLLKPGGLAFLTYHDETLYAERVGGPLSGTHVVGKGGPEGGALMGTYYRTPDWERRLSPYFKIVRTVPRGLFGDQSYTVVKKRRATTDRSKVLAEYAHSLERELFELRRGMKVNY